MRKKRRRHRAITRRRAGDEPRRRPALGIRTALQLQAISPGGMRPRDGWQSRRRRVGFDMRLCGAGRERSTRFRSSPALGAGSGAAATAAGVELLAFSTSSSRSSPSATRIPPRRVDALRRMRPMCGKALPTPTTPTHEAGGSGALTAVPGRAPARPRSPARTSRPRRAVWFRHPSGRPCPTGQAAARSIRQACSLSLQPRRELPASSTKLVTATLATVTHRPPVLAAPRRPG